MTITTTPAFQNMGTWIKGTEDFGDGRELKFCVKVFGEPSEVFGIDGGKVSKLEIRLGDEILANYDRGWDIEPADEVRPFYENILARFN